VLGTKHPAFLDDAYFDIWEACENRCDREPDGLGAWLKQPGHAAQSNVRRAVCNPALLRRDRRHAVKRGPAKWRPRTHEDRLLQQYWRKHPGCMVAEVPIGGAGGPGRWPTGSGRRRIDAVRLPGNALEPQIVSYRSARNHLGALTARCGVELVEVKPKLNRLVLGQALAAQDMFERQYGIRSPKMTIVCGRTDPALEWVCKRRGISVWVSTEGPSRRGPWTGRHTR
jgi:hypothetical protein